MERGLKGHKAEATTLGKQSRKASFRRGIEAKDRAGLTGAVRWEESFANGNST